jgi:MerR HTH family regulatory protein
MTVKHYTTSEVSKLLKINRVTLQGWVAKGEVKASIEIRNSGSTKRLLWTLQDVKDLHLYKECRRKAKQKLGICLQSTPFGPLPKPLPKATIDAFAREVRNARSFHL